ncbi:unnamed protein product [Urochloa humidicola]
MAQLLFSQTKERGKAHGANLGPKNQTTCIRRLRRRCSPELIWGSVPSRSPLKVNMKAKAIAVCLAMHITST